jgi:hypothetical protein
MPILCVSALSGFEIAVRTYMVAVLEDQLHVPWREGFFVGVAQLWIAVFTFFLLEIAFEVVGKIAVGLRIGASLFQRLVEVSGSLITPEVKCRIVPLLSPFFVRCVVVVGFHSSIPLCGMAIAEPVRSSYFRRETNARKVDEYFGVFPLGTC